MLTIGGSPRLSSGHFRHGSIYVKTGEWIEVDANDAETRKTLLEYVPSHIQFFPKQEAELAAAGLSLKDGKLSDLKAAKATEKPAQPKKTEKPTEK